MWVDYCPGRAVAGSAPKVLFTLNAWRSSTAVTTV
jgi:hypothetical protein